MKPFLELWRGWDWATKRCQSFAPRIVMDIADLCRERTSILDVIPSGRARQDPAIVAYVAGTRRRVFLASSLVRTHAQSRAQLESPRARVSYNAGCGFSPATVVRTGAQQSKRPGFLVAYGARHRTPQRLSQRKPYEGVAPMSWRRQRTTPQATLLRRQSEMITVSVHPGV